MKPIRGVTSPLSSRPSVQLPLRHKKMLERSKGWVVYRRRPKPIVTSNGVTPQRPGHRKVWMFSDGMSRYLGCTRRHLYWLLRNRSLPYHVFGSGPTPRYIFWLKEVRCWLLSYRGKGKQLGLRWLRFENDQKALALSQRGIWKHP